MFYCTITVTIVYDGLESTAGRNRIQLSRALSIIYGTKAIELLRKCKRRDVTRRNQTKRLDESSLELFTLSIVWR